MKTILVPLDGSALAAQVLPYVRTLAALLPARVRLFHVVTEGEQAQTRARGAVPPGAESTHNPVADAERCLASHTAELRAAGLDVDTEVSYGAPADRIIERAGCALDPLIVMATHGYDGLRRLALGSVAERVIRAAPCPVFMVRGSERKAAGDYAIRHMLLPLDGSQFAMQAVPPAIDIATRAQAGVLLLRAIAPMTNYPDVLIRQRNQAMQELRALAKDDRAAQIQMTCVVAIGPAAAVIAGEAQRRRSDLIVMATHGYGGWRRLALGSVADAVLHTTLTPLLLVRPQHGSA